MHPPAPTRWEDRDASRARRAVLGSRLDVPRRGGLRRRRPALRDSRAHGRAGGGAPRRPAPLAPARGLRRRRQPGAARAGVPPPSGQRDGALGPRPRQGRRLRPPRERARARRPRDPAPVRDGTRGGGALPARRARGRLRELSRAAALRAGLGDGPHALEHRRRGQPGPRRARPAPGGDAPVRPGAGELRESLPEAAAGPARPRRIRVRLPRDLDPRAGRPAPRAPPPGSLAQGRPAPRLSGRARGDLDRRARHA